MRSFFIILLSLELLSGCARQGDPRGTKTAYPDVFVPYDIALEFYKNDLGHYPSNALGLSALYQNIEATGTWRGPYINNTASSASGILYRLRDGDRDYELITLVNGTIVRSSSWARPKIKM